MLGCPQVELGDRTITNAATGCVQHSFDAYLVGWIDHGLEIGHGVLDLFAIVEPGAADDLVRDAITHQPFFNHS